ncbi:hypothetical protein [Cohnella algarum]|uniref:hypothetical protein n=1 Tax=Cohnella algarum TaxID=2044859 RepID=UPI0019679BB2|nr:hypothetical protein [Cohnella algarum]MBN2984977.1 hypothetical protein [Cohnella algarum]
MNQEYISKPENPQSNSPESRAPSTTENLAPEAISRRKMLRVLGLGGAMLAGSALLSNFSFAATEGQAEGKGSASPDTMLRVSSVDELLALPNGRLKDGTLAFVGGYRTAGDGGAKLMRWRRAARRPTTAERFTGLRERTDAGKSSTTGSGIFAGSGYSGRLRTRTTRSTRSSTIPPFIG